MEKFFNLTEDIEDHLNKWRDIPFLGWDDLIL